MKSKSLELALECKRLSESCLYTSTALFIWLRLLRYLKIIFIVVPLILGAVAGWRVLTNIELQSIKYGIAICSFIAGLLPTIYSSLKLDDYLDECKHLAGEFKNLQDRFRQLALVSSKKSFAEFEADVKPLIERLENARSVSVTTPEFIFKRAQKKVKSGDYDFDVDMSE
jgi:hypothetical protein